MVEKKRLKKGQARIQFIACRERIEELQAQGYDILGIHSVLVKEKRISMSYAGFYENITQRRKRNKAEKLRATNRLDAEKSKSGTFAPKKASDAHDKGFAAFSAKLDTVRTKASEASAGKGREGEYSDEEIL